ncbi:hypothetical protein RIF29_36132 [Crotalaria pallida]|uniref:Uncharacterized protein n=1 Tax=Crotalaria pallida TaxID=3830 RepID=A0AAN9HS48_CROPI
MVVGGDGEEKGKGKGKEKGKLIGGKLLNGIVLGLDGKLGSVGRVNCGTVGKEGRSSSESEGCVVKGGGAFPCGNGNVGIGGGKVDDPPEGEVVVCRSWRAARPVFITEKKEIARRKANMVQLCM